MPPPAMQALTSPAARSAARSAAPSASRALRRQQLRAFASDVPPVSWAQYRSGDKTLAEWVDANRHIVAGGMFAFYVGLAAWNLRPGKKSKAPAEPAAPDSAPAAP